MILPLEYVKRVCKIGQGANRCRFLISLNNGFMCVRHDPIRHEINDRVAMGLMIARGINCDGDYYMKCKAGMLVNGRCEASECIKLDESRCCGLCPDRDENCSICGELDERKNSEWLKWTKH